MEASLLIQHTPILRDNPHQGYQTPFSNLWPQAARELFLGMTISLHKPKQYRNTRKNTFRQNEWAFIPTAEKSNYERSNQEKQLIIWKAWLWRSWRIKTSWIIEHFSRAVHNRSLRQAGVGITAIPPPGKQMHHSLRVSVPGKTELQKGRFMAVSHYSSDTKMRGKNK